MVRRRSSTWDEDRRRQIDNPLQHYDLTELDEIARSFANDETFCADEELFVKAARIARDPPNWKNVPGLTDQERQALKGEKHLGFWAQPKALRVTVITLCFSAVVQGWVQSVSNGANQTMPEDLGLKGKGTQTSANNDSNEWHGAHSIWIFAGLNSITYLVAGIFGCWFSDPLQSAWLGRRGAIFIAACICLAAAIGAACTRNWQQLMVCRAILGLGLGAKASVTPIFGAEVSPSHLRGKLVMNWQLFDAFGIFCGFSANLIAYSTGNIAWKWQIASAAIPAFGLMLLILTAVPESPRWLLKKGKRADAFATLCALRQTPLQAATELFYANAQIQMEVDYFVKPQISKTLVEKNSPSLRTESRDPEAQHVEDVKFDPDIREPRFQREVSKTHYWMRIWLLFRNGRTRRAAIAASVVMLGQQLCGANVLAFYSTVFLRDINYSSTSNLQALWLSWGLGLANFLFTFPAYWGIDRLGRRFLLLVTYPFMFVFMLGACLSFLGGTPHEERIRVSVFMFLFFAAYSLGQGPVAFAYSSEVFPLFNREAGMSFAVFINLTGAGLLTLFVPQAQVSTTSAVAGQSSSDQSSQNPDNELWRHLQAKLLGAFAGFTVLSFLLIFFLVPETNAAATEKGKRTMSYMSLEELNHIFKIETWSFINYQVRHATPWAVRSVGHLLRLCDKPHLEVMHFWASEKEEKDKKGDTENDESQTSGHDNEYVNGQAKSHAYYSDPIQRINRRPVPGRPSDRHYQEQLTAPDGDHSSTEHLSVDVGESFEVKSE